MQEHVHASRSFQGKTGFHNPTVGDGGIISFWGQSAGVSAAASKLGFSQNGRESYKKDIKRLELEVMGNRDGEKGAYELLTVISMQVTGMKMPSL